MKPLFTPLLASFWIAAFCLAVPGITRAQPTAEQRCAAQSTVAREAVKRRSSVALFYALKLALVNGRVHEWRGDEPPRRVLADAKHVAVSARHGFAIDAESRLLRWEAGSTAIEPILDQVAFAAAGESGLLAIRCDGSLWQRKAGAPAWSRVADAAVHAWVGDSADYYIDPTGRLYVSGKAHRGQYGNGQLQEARGWLAVASGAVAVYSHTGHAVYLRDDGAVLGTGGNLAGPLGYHGYGDKAVRWGVIFDSASQLGTGNRHSLAIRPDGSLWSWGSADGLKPRQVLTDVAAATGGDNESLAIGTNGSVWNWRVGAEPQRVSLPP